MARYALKVVPGDWEVEMPLPFTEAEYHRDHETVEPGMHVAIYQDEPVNGMVSAGQVNLAFIHLDEWAVRNLGDLPKLHPEARYLLPLQIGFRRAGPGIMPRERVREILNDPEFPRPGESWLPITYEQYQELIAGWV